MLAKNGMKICANKNCREEKPISEFDKDNSKKDGLCIYCKICKREQVRTREYGKKRYQKWRSNHTRHVNAKATVESLKEKGCVICGYKRSFRALHFHHIGEKYREISRMNGTKKILNEAKKCILVCANCHAEIHEGLIDINLYN